MNCIEFKNRLSSRLGSLFLDSDEKIHLEQCLKCRNFYEEFVTLEKDLKKQTINPLSAVEFATMQQKLDEQINRYQRRAISFYSIFTRFGAGLAAIALLFLVSLWSGFEYGVYYTENSYQSDAYYYADNGYDISDEEETMNDEYIELLINDYTQSAGYNSTDLLLGDITADEFEYLENNFDLGDIL